MKSNSGGVLIEFVMVVSIFIIIAFAGYELSSCLKIKRLAMSLSKEIANSVYRDCPDLIDRDNEKTCLENVLNEFNSITKVISESAYYRTGVHWNTTGLLGKGTKGLDTSSIYYVCQSTSKDTNCNLSSLPNLPINFEVYKPIQSDIPLQVSNEIYIKYTPVISSIARLFGLQDGAYFYAKTIL